MVKVRPFDFQGINSRLFILEKWMHGTGDTMEGSHVKTAKSMLECEKQWKCYVSEHIHHTDALQ